MTPEESQRLLNMFGEGETITAAELASRMHGGKLKAYQKEPARKLAWHKIRKMEESGLVVKLQSRKGLPSTWAKV